CWPNLSHYSGEKTILSAEWSRHGAKMGFTKPEEYIETACRLWEHFPIETWLGAEGIVPSGSVRGLDAPRYTLKAIEDALESGGHLPKKSFVLFCIYKMGNGLWMQYLYQIRICLSADFKKLTNCSIWHRMLSGMLCDQRKAIYYPA